MPLHLVAFTNVKFALLRIVLPLLPVEGYHNGQVGLVSDCRAQPRYLEECRLGVLRIIG